MQVICLHFLKNCPETVRKQKPVTPLAPHISNVCVINTEEHRTHTEEDSSSELLLK